MLADKYFECNYGPADCPLDRWFGTFKERIEPKQGKHEGKQEPPTAEKLAVVTDAKATLLAPPEPSYLLYLSLTVVLPWMVLAHVLATPAALASWPMGPHSVSFLVAIWPAACAYLLVALSEPATLLATPRKLLAAPFYKEALLGALGLHLTLATAITILPVYHLVHTCLAEPGASAYCTMRGGC